MKLICCAAWLLAASPAFAEGPAPARTEVKEAKEEKEAFKVIHVKDLEDLQRKDKRVVIFDANGSAFRADYGVIPGSKMLSSSSHFAMSELPEAKDTPIVFYCANSHGMASHMAAGSAASNGFTNVSVMGDGLMGWKKAGKPTTPPPEATQK